MPIHAPFWWVFDRCYESRALLTPYVTSVRGCNVARALRMALVMTVMMKMMQLLDPAGSVDIELAIDGRAEASG